MNDYYTLCELLGVFISSTPDLSTTDPREILDQLSDTLASPLLRSAIDFHAENLVRFMIKCRLIQWDQATSKYVSTGFWTDDPQGAGSGIKNYTPRIVVRLISILSQYGRCTKGQIFEKLPIPRDRRSTLLSVLAAIGVIEIKRKIYIKTENLNLITHGMELFKSYRKERERRSDLVRRVTKALESKGIRADRITSRLESGVRIPQQQAVKVVRDGFPPHFWIDIDEHVEVIKKKRNLKEEMRDTEQVGEEQLSPIAFTPTMSPTLGMFSPAFSPFNYYGRMSPGRFE